MTNLRAIRTRGPAMRLVFLTALVLVLATRSASSDKTDDKGIAQGSDYRFDTSKLATVQPLGKLPSDRLRPSVFEERNVAQAFAEPLSEATKPRSLGNSRTAVLTADWRIERDPLEGALLVVRRQAGEAEPETEEGEPGGAAEAMLQQVKPRDNKLDDAKAKSLALDRLKRFGIPAAEIGETTSLRLVSQDLDGDSAKVGAVELMSYKTLVYRAINGIPVQGHHAVVTYWPDGSLKRTIVHWPAIAEKGNRLTTKLSVAEIERRAAGVLGREQVAKGTPVRLRWKYLPVKQKTGEVTLQLVVGARVPPPEKVPEGSFAEPREFEIAVDAM